MKNMKLTTALLALAGVAVITTSAKAVSQGDLILGMYDTTDTTTVSYEIDLGAFNSLTANQTWNLSSDISTVFSGSSSSNLVWTVAGAGTAFAGGGGLSTKEVALTLDSTTTIGTKPTSNSTEYTAINGQNNAIGTATTPVAGTTDGGVTIANSTSTSFDMEVATGGGSYGYNNDFVPGTGALTPYVTGDNANLWTLTGSGTTVDTELDAFSFDTADGVLTYDAQAVPEPSTYALGCCALLLLWVLKRRHDLAHNA